MDGLSEPIGDVKPTLLGNREARAGLHRPPWGASPLEAEVDALEPARALHAEVLLQHQLGGVEGALHPTLQGGVAVAAHEDVLPGQGWRVRASPPTSALPPSRGTSPRRTAPRSSPCSNWRGARAPRCRARPGAGRWRAGPWPGAPRRCPASGSPGPPCSGRRRAAWRCAPGDPSRSSPPRHRCTRSSAASAHRACRCRSSTSAGWGGRRWSGRW